MLFLSSFSLLSTKQNHDTNHHHYFFHVLLTKLIIAIISQCVYTSHGTCNQLDLDALSSFNQSIILPASNQLNWSLSVDCCSWEGVGCDQSGRVTNLSLPSRGLVGSIPPSITNLTALRILSLPHNELTGVIPQDIGRLSELEQLELYANQFGGTIPSSLTNCTKLTTLILRFNSLNGELSAFDFSKFVRLKLVDLGFNNFQGPLPLTLLSCKTITSIRLASNNITGQILPETAALPSLYFLSLANNSLISLTSAITVLARCNNLTTLLIGMNFYDETIPDDPNLIGPKGFQNLRILDLHGCRLTGRVPVWISQLQKLEAINLSQNKIRGSIPSWIGNLPNLFLLRFTDNLLSGDFPMGLIRLQRLSSPPADSNNTGYLDLPMFCQPNNDSNLQYKIISNLPRAIFLSNNQIGGRIPSEIGRLGFITILDIRNNNFSQKIPDTISNLTNIEKLDFSRNNLTGEIPISLKKLHFLSQFTVAYNDLEGPIPLGGQFDTFPRSSFEGNPGLCGGIWLRPCPSFEIGGDEDGSRREEPQDDEEEGIYIFNWVSFVIGFGLSFIVALIPAFRFFRPNGLDGEMHDGESNHFSVSSLVRGGGKLFVLGSKENSIVEIKDNK